jgi:Leucine-rich repeat (LRR) protein
MAELLDNYESNYCHFIITFMKKIVIIISLCMVFTSCRAPEKDQLLTFNELKAKRGYRNLDSLPANLTTIYKINLSGQSLKEIPAVIFKMSNLQELNVSKNGLTNLGDIDKLKNLQELNVGMNRLSVFPYKLINLKHLKILSLYWNDISTIPSNFYDSNSLEELDMTSMFKFDFAANLKSIYRLKKLKHLTLGNNQIPALNIDFVKLDNLQEFAFTGQHRVDIKDLLINLSKCKQLQIVHLSRNNIETLPDEISLLSQLKVLNLFENHIKYLPLKITNLKNLKEITLIDNPVDSIQISKVEKKLPQVKIIY